MSNIQSVNIQVDAGHGLGEQPHNWNYTGYDEINYTHTSEGEALLTNLVIFNEPLFQRKSTLMFSLTKY